MYLLTVRMRAFPPEHYPTWNQQLTDHFFYVAEERMTSYHAIHSSMMRNRYLKDLFEQYRGLTVAYDQGLVKGDATLATAVWRNVCKGEKDVDLQGLAQIVSYMRSVVSNLEKMGDQAIVSGDVVFGDPGEEEAWVKVKSRSLEAASIKPTREAPQVQAAPGKAKARA
jgi:cytochrome b pre-mRNA-processing protein 3